MRCFVALDIPDELRKAMEDFVRPLRGLSRGVRWVPGGNIHLTLKFLGDVPESSLPILADTLHGVASRHRPFPMTLRGTGAYPSLKRPRVLWIGVDENVGLQVLFREIDSALATLGFSSEERDFSPHITVGRVTEGRGIGGLVGQFSAGKGVIFGTIHVSEFALKESILKPGGPLYRDLYVFTLSGEEA